MKNILKLMALFAFLLCFISCDEDEKAEILHCRSLLLT